MDGHNESEVALCTCLSICSLWHFSILSCFVPVFTQPYFFILPSPCVLLAPNVERSDIVRLYSISAYFVMFSLINSEARCASNNSIPMWFNSLSLFGISLKSSTAESIQLNEGTESCLDSCSLIRPRKFWEQLSSAVFSLKLYCPLQRSEFQSTYCFLFSWSNIWKAAATATAFWFLYPKYIFDLFSYRCGLCTCFW
jgi:hypothetical protein